MLLALQQLPSHLQQDPYKHWHMRQYPPQGNNERKDQSTSPTTDHGCRCSGRSRWGVGDQIFLSIWSKRPSFNGPCFWMIYVMVLLGMRVYICVCVCVCGCGWGRPPYLFECCWAGIYSHFFLYYRLSIHLCYVGGNSPPRTRTRAFFLNGANESSLRRQLSTGSRVEGCPCWSTIGFYRTHMAAECCRKQQTTSDVRCCCCRRT